jgi:hypothetical protein
LDGKFKFLYHSSFNGRIQELHDKETRFSVFIGNDMVKLWPEMEDKKCQEEHEGISGFAPWTFT